MSSLRSPLSPSTRQPSNLERFLECVTPRVPSKFLPQSCFNDLNILWQPPGSKDIVEYFSLGDLWYCYDEWSAYGVGAQLLLNNGKSIMQYFVPYLSAIQIYGSKSVMTSRNLNPIGEHSDAVEFDSDCWSDESTNDKLSRSLSNDSSRTWDSISEESSLDHEGSLSTRDRLGSLYLQYFEICSPCWRIPLMEKINILAKDHPGLMTLKNVDLSPASWMAVAWYPIYHIPSQRNDKDLSTCFLTYHTLSSSFQDCGDKDSGRICLPPFGMATYKMQGDLWVEVDKSGHDNPDHERLNCLHSAADSWLKQLDVQHHDYNFFTFHSM